GRSEDLPYAPLLGWKPAGGEWMGASRLVSERKVVSQEFAVLRNGPACFEYLARYEFMGGGFYNCVVRVVPGVDRVDIVEDYDFGEQTEGEDFVLVELTKGMAPATVGWFGESSRLERKPYAEFVEATLKSGANSSAAVGGTGATPMPPIPEEGLVFADKILPAGKWGGSKGGVEIVGENAQVSAVTMHAGNWRRSLAITEWVDSDGGIVLAFPISTRPARWYAEVTDDISPFSTHEHDSTLPSSYGRREWALYFGDAPQELQGSAGYIGLDEYKNWILEWPDSKAEYPRAWFTAGGVAAIKASLERHPDREALEKYYLISGNPEDAVRHARHFIDSTRGQHGYMGNWNVAGLSHYRQSQSYLPDTHLAEDALACPELPEDLRREVRRELAVGAYMMSSPDLNPRGAGVHLGNNNMSINRSCVLAYFAGCLPDHPRYREWMDAITAHVAYKLQTQVAFDGATVECPTYWLYGPLRFLAPAIEIIKNTGGPDLAPQQARSLGYYANMTVPDARFNGRRIIPGMGNSGNILESIFGSTLATVERAMPEQAPLMQRLHRLAWPTQPLSPTLYNSRWFAWQYRPDIPEGGTLSTVFMPTYGVVFRNKFGEPDETAMLFRAGINWSHWDTDQGNVVLYGAGAPLSPGTGYQYYYGVANEKERIYHNQVKVGRRDLQEVFGRIDGAITDYGFLPAADYAANSRFYPSKLFDDGKGAMSWNRHVLFLKGERDYFVMRDAFPDAQGRPGAQGRPAWWTWLNLGAADKVTIDGQAFDPAHVPFDRDANDDDAPAIAGRVAEFATDFGASTWMWFASMPTFRARLTFTANNSGLLGLKPEEFPAQQDKETKTVIEAHSATGQDFHYVVFPKKDGSPAPACERLGDNAIKITTDESTDYVFISDRHIGNALTDGDNRITFECKAGAVRVYKDRVTFCLNASSGPFGRVSYNGTTFEGHGPLERTVAMADLKPELIKVGDAAKKERIAVELEGGITVEGEAPFTARLEGKKIVIVTKGRARVLYVTRPDWIRQPYGTFDGEPAMVCWTDYPNSGWGSYDRTALMGVPVPEGVHTIELTDRAFPPVWPRRFTPLR
ncbi:MAG: hypothetical protein FWF84_04515, partial [Kiritimatiellaeota bacterium]|nr:hypothetical protein [Kiritimatiellota bacterium]